MIYGFIHTFCSSLTFFFTHIVDIRVLLFLLKYPKHTDKYVILALATDYSDNMNIEIIIIHIHYIVHEKWSQDKCKSVDEQIHKYMYLTAYAINEFNAFVILYTLLDHDLL